MSIPFVLSNEAASVFLDFTPYTVPSSHPNWEKILEALASPTTTADDIRPLLDVAATVADYMNGAVEYRDRALFFDGKPIDTQLTRRILAHMNAGQEGLAEPLVEFLKRVMSNPSRRAVMGLYDWVEASGLPITPDGYIMAYKIVNEDFTDCYTRTFDNSPGKIVEVPRNQVDEDPDVTCSYGLHVCSAGYLPNYGPSNKQVVIVKVDPADFVAVPRDYRCAKARVCKYEVLQAVPKETAAQFFPNEYVYDPTPETEIDWDLPIETVDGRYAEVVRHRNAGDCEDFDYVVDFLYNSDGGWFYRADGTHIYGIQPDLRNIP